ncbi:hypothetical protein DB44_GT00040 [Candidatus Protochlamydia amoebophila]|uniref:Uncharacterized protein n=1 Tax=Candidatus Protochlamydia amoebophila TaxID=362787 RepID=A0A0C1JGT7_9BACT|nr:hypothetical protein DB44_GT00040 [Candidatus Protochlamydia amoebophila]
MKWCGSATELIDVVLVKVQVVNKFKHQHIARTKRGVVPKMVQLQMSMWCDVG